MMEATAHPMPMDGNGLPADSAGGDIVIDPHAMHIGAQIEEFRKQLLGMTLRNQLLNCPHDSRAGAQVRTIDELPDTVFEQLEAGDEFAFLPLPEPRDEPDDEDSEEFLKILNAYKEKSAIYGAAVEQLSRQAGRKAALESIEREARDHARLQLGMDVWTSERGLGADDLCRRHGIAPGYELPYSSEAEFADRHHDNALQTKMSEEDLSASLGRLRDRARSSVSQTGVATLFAAFGFLEWFESDDSDQSHLAPLVLFPGELERRLERGKYRYRFWGNGETATGNVTLSVYLRQNFGLELPAFEADDSPESYFEKVLKEICAHRRRWRIRRFLTIGIFSYSKLAIYEDLDGLGWSAGQGLVGHGNIRTLLAQSGVSDIPYAETRDIDEDEGIRVVPVLIYDADSSQHSAIADVLSGKNLTIFGPPGTGKSQTIGNTIAAAMMAGKRVLFVAEKLTALEVVWDRLDKAGLGPFCFNLHARGLRAGEVRKSLQDRLVMARPAFDPSHYEQQKVAWTRQRDALRTYARVLGAKVGNLDETVHDVLWRTIRRKGSEKGLPPAVSTAQVENVEGVTAARMDEARGCIRRLENAEAEVIRLAGMDGALPWRGVQHADLAPVEVGTVVRMVQEWEERLGELEGLLHGNGLDGRSMTIREAGLVQAGAGLVQGMPDAMAGCDLSGLSRKEARAGIDVAADRARRLREVVEEMGLRFSLGPEELPRENDLRALATEALSLGVSERLPAEARAEAQTLRDRAGEQERIDGILERLRNFLALDVEVIEADETVERALEVLKGADADLLSSRTGPLMAYGARRIIEQAEAACRELKQLLDRLGGRFDLASLPGTDGLRQAARSMNASRGPLLFDRAARDAMRVHQEVSLGRGKPSKEQAAIDFRALIEYREKTAQLEGNDSFRNCLGADWRGVDTDFARARRVADWAAKVFGRLVGEGDGRSETRKLLLSGDLARLEEIQRIAESLPQDWRHSECALKPTEARERATYLEELAEGLRALGLDESVRMAEAEDLAELIEECRRLRADADSDESLARVFPSSRPDCGTLESVRALADAMSELGLSDASWSQVADFLANATDPGDAGASLRDTLVSVRKAWLECVGALRLDEPAFLDGGQHETMPLGALRRRARGSRDAADALLPWCVYQRARNAVQGSHAGPVLAALEEHDMRASWLGEAYEWALYRSLAAEVYRRHPVLIELDSGQLGDHREEFRKLEARLQELERTRIAYELYSRPVDQGVSFGRPGEFTEKALIQRQLSLQRSSVTSRDLIRRAGTALRQLKPCFMMSPTTVAELLPRDSELFDIVIIDEASQMLPCDALGAIGRARQAVIVGDPKQLPPSTYFQGGALAAVGADDGDDMLAPLVESILDLSLSAWQPPRYLQWHYRSRHSSLIQFSNARFYANRLIVFPGPDEGREESGIRFHHVEDGLAKGGLNPVEAERVVRAACAFMEDPGNGDLSLAIVAMNQRQRDQINDMMDTEMTRNPAVARYRRRWRNTLYPFMVRNLETVQGDERDVIYISTVYGRETAGGPVMRRFGPITHAGGERRLNVLFSRARQRMEVFSSMQANDIAVGPGISEGVRILRDYLEYAATGKIEAGIDTGKQPESPFEEHVLERLRAQGLDVEPQVGVAGYRIDLGIRHPDYPHGYLLGVECDGRTYHSAQSVRDRDRLREAVLRGLGWDIYRIWSTDWFRDADRELKKLMEYIEERIDAYRAGLAAGQEEMVLMGEADRHLRESLADTLGFEEKPEAPGDEPRYVEVGDTVSYREAGREEELCRVTIVRGVGDPAIGMNNDSRPFSVALMGAEVGEKVSVRQATSEVEVVVVGIDRPESEGQETIDPGALAWMDSLELSPYPEWSGNAPDPRSASVEEVAGTLVEIVETEGPVMVGRAYQALVRGSGLLRLGPQIRQALDRALMRLETEKRVAVERREEGRGYKSALLRTPGSDRVKVREIGPRSFDEVPHSELSELVRVVRRSKAGAGFEEICREVLGIYGLVRMTAQVRKRFQEVEELSSR